MRRDLQTGFALVVLFAATAALIPTAAHSKDGQATAATTKRSDSSRIDPAVTEALDKMAAYLRTLKAYQVHAKTGREDVLEDGQKVQRDSDIDVLVQTPNRLRFEVVDDQGRRLYFYNGNAFTGWSMQSDQYATMPAPATILELSDVLQDKYNIDVPLADLFLWGTPRSKSKDITDAIDVGPSEIEGTTCEHYALRQPGLDWQVWIQNGNYPLPRRLIITTLTDEARPQYQSVVTWNLAPSYDESAFTFTAPPDAHRVVFAQIAPKVRQR